MTARSGLIAGLIAATALSMAAADVLTELGIPASEATQMAVQGVTTGGMPWGSARQKFRAASAQQRVVIVRNVMGWAKTFTASPAFASAYAQAREHMKPEKPANALGMDDQMKQQMAELDKSEAEMKTQFANQPDLLKQMLANLAMARKQMLEMSKNADVRKAMDQGNAQAKKDYEARLAKFDQEHPADVRSAIAVRLHSFLNTCGDVDFGAKLTPAGRKMRFADEKYEQKPEAWKVCYRVGKEPLEAARAAAQEWLKEMGK